MLHGWNAGILYILLFFYFKVVWGEREGKVLTSSWFYLPFFLPSEEEKWTGRYSKEGILKWHSSCHGSPEDSSSSCQKLWKGGWFLSAGLQLPWLALLSPAGWYQGTSTLISKYCAPCEPNDLVAAFIVLQGSKTTRKWIWEKSPRVRSLDLGTF